MAHFFRLAPLGAEAFLTAEVADSFFRRFFGLMGRSPLPPKRGLLLTPCNGIHTLFMGFPIDVIFLDKDLRILKIAENLSPWLGISLCPRAHACLELSAGGVKELGWKKGMRLAATEEQ